MKKSVLRSIICFLLSAVMITECNLGAISVYATEMTEETVAEDMESELDEAVLEEEQEDSSEETEEIITASSYLRCPTILKRARLSCSKRPSLTEYSLARYIW